MMVMMIHDIELVPLDHQEESSTSSDVNNNNNNNIVQLCSMCGDVGFTEELFQCRSCRKRLQHRYCSSIWSADEIRVCEWCLHAKRRRTLQPDCINSEITQQYRAGATIKYARESSSVTNIRGGAAKCRETSNSSRRSAAAAARRHDAANRPALFLKKQGAVDNDSSASYSSSTISASAGAGKANRAKPFLQTPTANTGTYGRRFRSLHDVLCSSC